MSDYIIKIIPRTPNFIIDKQAAEKVIKMLENIHVNSDDITYTVHDGVEFIDCGGDLETIKCPVCGKDLAEDEWSEAVNTAYETGFTMLDITMLCCGSRCSLNELDYHFPDG